MLEKLSLFCIGALGYGAIEYLYRGHTHWTMLLAGGLCLIGLYSLNLHFAGLPLVLRCVLGAGLITGIELLFGLFFNRGLHMAIWDYSDHWGNFAGQICPFYSFVWFLLCVPILKCLSLSQQSTQGSGKKP